MPVDINLTDYAQGGLDNQVLFDSSSQASVEELNKALEALEITGRDTADLTTASGAPLKVESLEKNLTITTFKESDIRFWKRIEKVPAYNTVEEYNQLQSYGNDTGGFTAEGELPEEEDSIYVRRAELVKFLGITKAVTHPMQLVTTHIGDVIQRETQNGIAWILRKADKSLFNANASLIPQEFNGFLTQHYVNGGYATLDSYYENNEIVVDMRGKALSESDITNGSEAIMRNYGHADLLMAPPVVLTDFVNRFLTMKLISPNTPQVTAGVMGQVVQKFASQYGEIDLDYDLFMMRPGSKLTTTPASTSKCPAAIVPDIANPLVNAADVNTKFVAADLGDYYYGVAANNRYGQGAVTAMSAAVLNITAAHCGAVKFADGGGAYPATSYTIYRSKKNPTGAITATLLYPLFTIPAATFAAAGYDGGAAGIAWDRNRILPGTEEAFLAQGDSEVMLFKQLAPIMKMDLAILSPAKRWMVLMYGTPILKAPRKLLRFVNVGRDMTP